MSAERFVLDFLLLNRDLKSLVEQIENMIKMSQESYLLMTKARTCQAQATRSTPVEFKVATLLCSAHNTGIFPECFPSLGNKHVRSHGI